MKNDLFNLFAVPVVDPGNEEVSILYEDETTRIERIVSNAAASKDNFWYDQEEHEWVSVLSGEAVLQLEDKMITIKAGDSLMIPAHTRHRIVMTSSLCIWLCVFSKTQ